MATSTINHSGQDYDTLTLWEDDKNGDLVKDNRQETAECYDDDGTLDDFVTIDGSTTNATYFMKVTSPVAKRHDGTTSSGFTLTNALANTHWTIDALDPYTVIEWLIVTNTVNKEIQATVKLDATQTMARNNVVTMPTTANASFAVYGIHMADDQSCYILNNFVLGTRAGLSSAAGIYGDGSFHSVLNNTVYVSLGTQVGILARSGDGAKVGDCKNNIAINEATEGGEVDFSFVANTDNDYNASQDATATGVNSINTASVSDFESSTDLHLTTGAPEIDDGTNLGTTNGVNYDIDNRDRDGEGDTWDMGAHEFVAAAGVAGFMTANKFWGA